MAGDIGPDSYDADFATTVIFSDDPIVPGVTAVKADHINELRTAINAFRVGFGVGTTFFTDPISSGVTIKAAHVIELRSRFEEAFEYPPIWTDPMLAAGDIIKSVHIQQLRDAVK